jgi:hypothetical protein
MTRKYSRPPARCGGREVEEEYACALRFRSALLLLLARQKVVDIM